MKFSNTYIFYPVNKALERAIANSIARLGEESAKVAAPDTGVTTADNFLYTRGNYEQHRFSSNILDSAREVLETTLTDEYRDQEPLAWAETHNSLGNILESLTRKSHPSTGQQHKITWEPQSRLWAGNWITRNC